MSHINEELLTNDEPDFDACDERHTSEVVLKHVLWCSTNIFFFNFCRRINDEILKANADKNKKKLSKK